MTERFYCGWSAPVMLRCRCLFVSEIRMNTRFSVFPHPQSGAVTIKKKPDPRTPDRLKEILKPANGWNSIHLTTATVLRIPPILFLAAALASSPIAIFLP